MTTAEREKRQAKASTLQVSPMEDDIYRDPSGSLMAGRWLVTCESDPAMRHQVRFEGQALARWSCSCQDYRHHREAEPSWACKHIVAVQARTQPQVPGAPTMTVAIGFAAPAITERERIDLECQAMFGDRAAIERLNGKPTRPSTYEPAPSVEVPRTPQPAAAALLDEPALEDGPEVGCWIDCCPGCGRSLPECTCKEEVKAASPVPSLASIHAALTRPFPIALVEVKPGAIANGKALALAYVDSRAYQARLDEVAGPDNWSVEYRPLGERAVICRLTILEVVREDVGEADPAEANAATCMIAQAFKRACASFGLGRYLYSLPKVWAEMSGKAIKDPEAAIQAMYRELKA